MAFIDNPTLGSTYQPGWFLAKEECRRITEQFNQNGNNGSGGDITVTTAPNGGKYVPMGTLYKKAGTAIGIVYEDVDVTVGDMSGSVVTAGYVYDDRVASGVKSALESANKSIVFVGNAPKVFRATAAPAISTATEKLESDSNLTADITADRDFADALTKDNFIIDPGKSGLSFSSAAPSGKSVTITFSGTSAAGSVTVAAKPSAFKDADQNSNTLTIQSDASVD